MKLRRIIALTLVLVMCALAFAGCGSKKEEERVQNTETPLVVGYSDFSSKFSPFFAETAYDQDASAMTQIGLLTSDRMGSIIEKGIDGQTVAYNGKDYKYYGPADLKITENEDGTVDYDFTLREDLKFSDGEALTIDDVIFSMYVLCDPTYDGASTLFAVPIEGMDEYRAGMTYLSAYLAEVGRDNTDFSLVTEEQQKKFWEAVDGGLTEFAQEIVDLCKSEGYNAADDSVAACAANWGYDGLADDATVTDFAEAIGANYEWKFSAMEAETAGSALSDLIDEDVYNNYPTIGVKYGESADSIKGIQKTGKNTLRVRLTQVDATAIYQLGVAIAPMHYYGDKSLYDYDNNSFGFKKGDLSSVRAKTTQPLGAGPYKFIKFENGVINYEANDDYYLGKPLTKYVNFQECHADDDKVNGITTGNIDITDPAFNDDTVKTVKKTNSNGELTGDKIETSTVDNLGYGYIGMSANVMKVGTDGSSEESKALRKAFATVLAVYRDVSIDSYYGDRASVINYPISNTSWAAPQSTDDGYKVAFSVDADGKDIYTSDMSAEDKYKAAQQAALGFFKKAGYTVENGKVTAAPEGASLEYTCWIPADGTGNHPTFMVLDEAKRSFEEIGINFIIKDLTNSSDLWTALEAEQVAIWVAAWGATVDPDMYQIYFSGDDTRPAGGSNYMYDINDPELNKMILEARTSTDQAYRKQMYKACLDIVVDWAVEIPVYQRQNAVLFSAERVKLDTVTPDITTFYGWMNEIENIEVVSGK